MAKSKCLDSTTRFSDIPNAFLGSLWALLLYPKFVQSKRSLRWTLCRLHQTFTKHYSLAWNIFPIFALCLQCSVKLGQCDMVDLYEFTNSPHMNWYWFVLVCVWVRGLHIHCEPKASSYCWTTFFSTNCLNLFFFHIMQWNIIWFLWNFSFQFLYWFSFARVPTWCIMMLCMS